MGTVLRLASNTSRTPEALADDLERIAQQIRSGEVGADTALLILRNGTAGGYHPVCNLGADMTTTDILGMLAYASHQAFIDKETE